MSSFGSFELGKSGGKGAICTVFRIEASCLEMISPGLNIVVNYRSLGNYDLSERIFVRFPSRSFWISFESSKARVDEVAKCRDCFNGIIVDIVGPYIILFEFIDEVEVDLVEVVRNARNYSRNKTVTTNPVIKALILI